MVAGDDDGLDARLRESPDTAGELPLVRRRRIAGLVDVASKDDEIHVRLDGGIERLIE